MTTSQIDLLIRRSATKVICFPNLLPVEISRQLFVATFRNIFRWYLTSGGSRTLGKISSGYPEADHRAFVLIGWVCPYGKH
jgi:hypothetical protein